MKRITVKDVLKAAKAYKTTELQLVKPFFVGTLDKFFSITDEVTTVYFSHAELRLVIKQANAALKAAGAPVDRKRKAYK